MIDPKLIDIDFKFDGLSGDILEQDLLYAGAKSFPDKFLVDRSEWTIGLERMISIKVVPIILVADLHTNLIAMNAFATPHINLL